MPMSHPRNPFFHFEFHLRSPVLFDGFFFRLLVEHANKQHDDDDYDESSPSSCILYDAETGVSVEI